MKFEESIKFCLSQEATKSSANKIILEYKNTCPQESRFINGLNFSEKNQFKQLWVDSFFSGSLGIDRDRNFTINHQPFQYWSQGRVPSDLSHLQSIWNREFLKIGAKQIKTFSRDTALEWITNNAPTFRKAFESAPHYAVESDIFRIAYAIHNDCIYLDIDSYPLPKTIDNLRQKISSAQTTLLFAQPMPYLVNGVFATLKMSPFFLSIETELSDYSFQQREVTQNLIEGSFGPKRYSGTLNKLINNGQLRLASQSDQKTHLNSQNFDWTINFINSYNFCRNSPPWPLAYKQTSNAWKNYVREQGGRIK